MNFSRKNFRNRLDENLLKSKFQTSKNFLGLKIKIPFITYSSKEFQNEEYNEYMEDFIYTEENFDKDKSQFLFCVFDGHGGDKSAIICNNNFSKIFSKNLKKNKNDIEQSFYDSFQEIDNKCKKEDCYYEGNTMTVVFIKENKLYCANVGDSSCMIINESKAIKLSVDHLCGDKNEQIRLQKEGCKIIDYKIEGELSLSRSIGDHEYKKCGLICEPDIKVIMFTPRDRYCVIASDGVWDVVASTDLVKFSNECKDAKEMCEKIVNSAIKGGSQDNISCIVIGFWKD